MIQGKGSCLFNNVNRTKFSSEEDAKEYYNMLVSIEIKSKYDTPYKCEKCNYWHLGSN